MKPSRIFAVVVAAIVAASLLASCKSSTAAEGPKGHGRVLAEGPARAVTPSPDGAFVGYVAEPRPARELGQGDLPDDIKLGTGAVVAAAGGAPIVLGKGVSTLPGSIVFDAEGRRVAALVDFAFKKQQGTLVVADLPGGNLRSVAEGVSFVAFSPDGKTLGYVAKDVLHVGPASGATPAEALGPAATFEFSPDAKQLLVRRPLAADGSLLLAEVPAPGAAKAEPRRLAFGVADYGWSPAGDRIAFTARGTDGSSELFVAEPGAEPKKLATGVPGFGFGADGKSLAFVAGVSFEKQFGDLMLLPPGKTEAVKLATKINEWRYSTDGGRIAWIEKYEPTARVGTLGYATVDAEPKPKSLGDEVLGFHWSRTSNYLAYTQRTLRPMLSVDLFLEKVGGDGPHKVATGVFGYGFDADDQQLLFKDACTRNGRSCDLKTVPTAAPEAAPKRIATGVYTFDFDASLRNLMLTYARVDADALDVAVVPVDGSRPPVTVDWYVAPGTKWLGKTDRIAYAVLAHKKQGVYLADLEALPPPEATAGAEE